MSSRILTQEHVTQVNLLKKKGVLLRVVPGENVVQVPVAIAVLCNSGPQLQDRLTFYWGHVARTVHPILRHGGIVRQSSKDGLFDPSIESEVNEALHLMAEGNVNVDRLVVGGHFDCSFCCHKRMSLTETLVHSLLGYRNFSRVFRSRIPDIQFYFHMDWSTLEGEKKRLMETFLVDPDALSGLVMEHIDVSAIRLE